MDEEQKKQEAARAVESAKTVAGAARAKAIELLAEANKTGTPEDRTKADEAEGVAKDVEQKLADAEAAVLALGGDDDIDEMLRDGTPKDKNISVPFNKFRELNEKATLFQQFSPVLAKLKENPDLIDKLMAGDDETKTLAERINALEKRESDLKRDEVKTTIAKAISTWPDFKTKWEQIKPILASLEKTGIAYADAVQRAYFAVNPDATKETARLHDAAAAREAENSRGSIGNHGGGGSGPIVRPGGTQDAYRMTAEDSAFASKLNIDPKLYQKHADFIAKFAEL